jgi:predicted DNA-binding protein YlxM (UPF0122 family)
MNKREKLVELYLIYGNLLTNNERSYFEYYYYEDYSLTEIAENHNVSKANVSKVINIVNDKLLEYEEKLKINDKNKKIKEIIKKTNDKNLLEKIDELL